MPKRSGYPIRLTLPKEERVALTLLTAQEESAKDLVQAQKVFRLGLHCYKVLSEDALSSMYQRGLMSDDEVQYWLENGFIKEDFRPIKTEALLQAEERKHLNNQFRHVIDCWSGITESSKMYWLKTAKKYPDLPNAKKLILMVKELMK